MKKLFVALAILVFICSFAACGQQTALTRETPWDAAPEEPRTTGPERPRAEGGKGYSLYGLYYDLPESFREESGSPYVRTYYSGEEAAVTVSVYTPGEDFDLAAYVQQQSLASLARAAAESVTLNGTEWLKGTDAAGKTYYYGRPARYLFEIVVGPGETGAAEMLDATLFAADLA